MLIVLMSTSVFFKIQLSAALHVRAACALGGTRRCVPELKLYSKEVIVVEIDICIAMH